LISDAFPLEQDEPLSNARDLSGGYCSASASQITESPSTADAFLRDQFTYVILCH
jgi:hypothetical protein